MADNNNNNNGNPIVNPNNFGRNNNGLDNSELRQSISINADRIIEAIKENGGNNSRNINNNREKNEAEKIIDAHIQDIQKLEKIQNKRIRDEIKNNDALTKLQRIKDLSRRGSEEERKVANRFLELKKDEITRLENNIKKQAELEAQQRTLEQKEVKLNEERIKLIERESSTSDTAELAVIEKRLNEIVSELEDTKDEQKTTTDQLNELAADRSSQYIAQELRDTTNLISTVSQNTDNMAENVDSIEAEQRKENKRKAKEEKIKNAKDYKIAENLEDCFSDGLFGLAGNLDKTFKEATNNHINAMKGSIAGNIVGFVEKSLFSVADYTVSKFTDAIGTLQSSFESTGMELSKAILMDRNEIVNEYQDVADRLQEEGFDKALNATDIIGFETQIAKAGITDENLISEIAYQFGKVSSVTGVGLPDLLSDEVLIALQDTYKTTGSLDEVTKELNAVSTAIVNGVDAVGSATGISQGKIQETTLNYVKDVVQYGFEDATDKFQDTVATQLGTGQYVGGSGVFQRMISALESSRNENVSADLLSNMQDIFTQEQYDEMIKSGDYLGALTNILEKIDELGTSDTTNTALSWLGVSPQDWRQLVSREGGISAVIEDINEARSAMASGEGSTEYQRRTNLVKEGRTNTVEQNLRNKVINEATGVWGEAVKTGIPESTQMLVASINAANSGIQSAISFGIEKLINHFTGAGANVVGSLLSGGAAGAGSSSAIGALGATVGGKAIGLGPTVAIGAATFAASYGLGTKINEWTKASDKISDAIVGAIAPTQEAINNLKEIEEANRSQNDEYHNIVKDLLEKNNNISEDTKQAIAGDLDKLIDNTIDTKNSRQAFAKTLREGIESGDIQDKSTGMNIAKSIKVMTGKDVSELSDDELINYYNENKSWFDYSGNSNLGDQVQLSEQSYKQSEGKERWDYVDSILSSFANDGIITAEESTQAAKELRSALIDEGKSEEDIDKFMESFRMRTKQTNDYYSAYQAATRVKDAILAELETVDRSNVDAADKILSIIQDYKNGIYPGMTDQEKMFVERAKIYFKEDSNSNDVKAGLKIIDPNKPFYELYSPDNVSKFATGLDYVPYDNFPALLHKGERVVTAADARLDDLANSVYLQQIYSSNFNKDNNNIEDLTTTNNSIEQGFNTTADNQSAIIAALQAIINILSNNQTSNMYRDMNNVFNDINTNSIALRTNNIAKMASAH